MSSGNNQINFVASAGTPNGVPFGQPTNLGALLWQGFQQGATQRPVGQPEGSFFM